MDFLRVIILWRTIDCDRHRSSKALRESVFFNLILLIVTLLYHYL